MTFTSRAFASRELEGKLLACQAFVQSLGEFHSSNAQNTPLARKATIKVEETDRKIKAKSAELPDSGWRQLLTARQWFEDSLASHVQLHNLNGSPRTQIYASYFRLSLWGLSKLNAPDLPAAPLPLCTETEQLGI